MERMCDVMAQLEQGKGKHTQEVEAGDIKGKLKSAIAMFQYFGTASACVSSDSFALGQ